MHGPSPDVGRGGPMGSGGVRIHAYSTGAPQPLDQPDSTFALTHRSGGSAEAARGALIGFLTRSVTLLCLYASKLPFSAG